MNLKLYILPPRQQDLHSQELKPLAEFATAPSMPQAQQLPIAHAFWKAPLWDEFLGYLLASQPSQERVRIPTVGPPPEAFQPHPRQVPAGESSLSALQPLRVDHGCE